MGSKEPEDPKIEAPAPHEEEKPHFILEVQDSVLGEESVFNGESSS